MATEKEIVYNRTLPSLSKSERQKIKEDTLNNLKNQTVDDFVPMSIITDKNTNENYLIISRKENEIELVNVNDFGDYFYFILEEDNCPYKFYRTLGKDEFEEYTKKIEEYKTILGMIS